MQDTIGKGLNKFQDSINKNKNKLDLMKEISKLNEITKEISEKKVNLLIELGHTTYFKFREGKIEDAELQGICAKFIELDSMIYKYKRKIDELSQSTQIKCDCGMELQEGTKFCSNCGNNTESLKKVDNVTCNICEEEVPNNVAFCPSCGNKR